MKRLLPVLAGLVLVAGCGSSGHVADPPQAGVPGPGHVSVPATWRAESFHHVQLRVPPAWVEGVSPMGRSGCGVGANPFADAVRAGAAYVGRPVYGSDVCATQQGHDPAPPEGDAVWFASPLPLGSQGDAVTVSAGGEHVTVAATDHDLRSQILSSITAHAVDANGCRVTQHVGALWPREGFGTIRGLAVCVYDGGRLLWSQKRSPADARAFWTAFLHGNTIRSWPPSTERTTQTIVLRVTGDDPMGSGEVTVDLAMRLDPPRISSPVGSVTVQLPVVRPWASPGLRLYAQGPTGPQEPTSPYFRSMLG